MFKSNCIFARETQDDVYEGSVKFKNLQQRGHLYFDFGDNGAFETYLVDTDYENCTVVYVCGVTGGKIFENTVKT